MMPEQTERAIEFLLNNQANQDVRLAKLESVVSQLAENRKEMQEGMILLQTELREGIEKIVTISEETQRAAKDVLELETRTFRRVKFVETQVGSLEERVQV
jgi:hypothetical protein